MNSRLSLSCNRPIGVTTLLWLLLTAGLGVPNAVVSASETTPGDVATIRESAAGTDYRGDNISLSYQHIDIRAALQIIADVAGVNIVVANNVAGSITLNLQNVPWDQALHVILQSHGLGMRRIGNVINIAPLNRMAERKQAALAADLARRSLLPLRTDIIRVNYAKAEAIAALIRSEDGSTALLSTRGRVTVDTRTNSLLITDTAAKLARVERIVNRLDIPVRQVMVEARIVVANRGFSRELGVTQNVSVTGIMHSSDDSGGYQTKNGFVINLPVVGAAGTFVTSIISDSFNLNLALSALETENRGEIISAPRVITTDGQKAVIKQGKEIPYVTQQGTDSPATTSFKEVTLTLAVTPHITPNGHVLLNLNLTQDNVSGWTQSGQPIINTRRLQTQVLVDNGNTVVLGGIYQHQTNNADSQIPFLGDVPVVGFLFSGTKRKHSKLELLLFITPRVLQETLSSR